MKPMRRRWGVVLVVVLLTGCAAHRPPEPDPALAPLPAHGVRPAASGEITDANSMNNLLIVMTYNILLNAPKEGFDRWQVRQFHVAQRINYFAPDLIGLQEPFPGQLTDLHRLCPGYAQVGLGFYTDSTIFYKADRFELLDSGHLWHSPTGERKGATTYGNFMPRYWVWAKLRDRLHDRVFFFVNTHFDNTQPFQPTVAPEFMKRVDALVGDTPVIVVGDFNSAPPTPAYATLTGEDPERGLRLVDSFATTNEKTRVYMQSGGEPVIVDADKRIDHIFFSEGDWQFTGWITDLRRYGTPPRFPSDHAPVTGWFLYPRE